MNWYSNDTRRRGFTLVELLAVVGILALLMGTLTYSLSQAQEKSRMARAESEVKVIAQAILAYENYDKNHELSAMEDVDADEGSLGFLLGNGESTSSGDKVPTLIMAQLRSGGKLLDPWNTPYKVSIKPGTAQLAVTPVNMSTGYYYPNYYILSAEERE